MDTGYNVADMLDSRRNHLKKAKRPPVPAASSLAQELRKSV